MDVNELLTQQYSVKRFGAIKSTIEHNMPSMECFASKSFGEQNMIGCYSDTTSYTEVYEDEDLERRYREGLMSVSVKNIHS